MQGLECKILRMSQCLLECSPIKFMPDCGSLQNGGGLQDRVSLVLLAGGSGKRMGVISSQNLTTLLSCCFIALHFLELLSRLGFMGV